MKIKFYVDENFFAREIADEEKTPHLMDLFEASEEDIKIAFGKGVKAMRTAKNVSLTEMENALDIPNPSLSRYENGKNAPSITQAYKIANYFETDIPAIIFIGLMEMYPSIVIERALSVSGERIDFSDDEQ